MTGATPTPLPQTIAGHTPMSVPRPSHRAAPPTSEAGSSSSTVKQRSTSSSSAAAAQPSALFIKERERIITEIADGMEQILGNVNTINRKLEESVAVGQEFEPIANLWGPFMDMLTGHGLTPATNDQQAASQGGGGGGTAAAREDAMRASSAGVSLAASFEGPHANRLPPGVAPGGGTVYGMSS